MNDLATANRGLSRSVLLGLTLLAAIAIIGPVVSYVADEHEARTQLQGRIALTAAADALAFLRKVRSFR